MSPRLTLVTLVLALKLPAAAVDLCEQKVPTSLKLVLNTRFPGFRLPRLSDQDEETTTFNKQAGFDGCVTVGTGDFDGDGQRDVALVLTNPKSGEVLLVVALRRGQSWAVHRPPTWCGPIDRCYVETAKPGLFKRAESFDEPPTAPDERAEIRSRTESVLSGTVGSTGIVYVYSKGKWLYVWVSD